MWVPMVYKHIRVFECTFQVLIWRQDNIELLPRNVQSTEYGSEDRE